MRGDLSESRGTLHPMKAYAKPGKAEPMKKSGVVCFAALAGLLLTPALSRAQLSYDQAVTYCKSLGEMAAAIMESRQLEVDPNEQLKSLAGIDNEHWEQLGAKLVGAAYERPAYADENKRKRATQEFRNEYEHACYKMYLD
jgi:hypothetical protein